MAKIDVNGSSLTWNSLTVPALRSASITGTDVTDIATTDLSSTTETSDPGFPEEGTLTVEFFHDPDNATYAGMKADRTARTTRTVKLTLASGTAKVRTWAGCYIKRLDTAGSINGKWMTTVVIKLTATGADAAS